MGAERHDHRLKELGRALDEVHVPVGDRIEASGINGEALGRDLGHGVLVGSSDGVFGRGLGFCGFSAGFSGLEAAEEGGAAEEEGGACAPANAGGGARCGGGGRSSSRSARASSGKVTRK